MAARPDRTARHSRKGAAAPFSTVAARFHALAVRKLYILGFAGWNRLTSGVAHFRVSSSLISVA
jgi:hypothetical protein